MLKLLIILIVALHFEAIGVIFLSKGLKEIGQPSALNVSEISRLIGRGFRNVNLLTGVAFEAVFFVGLLVLMSKGDVSFIWPLTSLSFVVTTLAAVFFLKEQVTPMRWAGVTLIMCGAAFIIYSEKMQEAARARQKTISEQSKVSLP
ncbi:MAG: EamA family transporter [Verrucomicrobiota bacterium]|nr:EamA family transporter [Verrucomicrobiota bacterium]